MTIEKTLAYFEIWTFAVKYESVMFYITCPRGCIFSRVRPFYERAVSDLDRSMHRSLWGLGHSQLAHKRVAHD